MITPQTAPASRRLRRAVVLLAAAGLLLGACGDGDEGDDASASTTEEASGSSTSEAGTASTTAPSESSSTTSEAASSTTTAPAFEGDQAPDVGEPDGTGTAQLVAARLGAQDGYTRFVLEMEGETRPGWDARWVEGPITEDASGNPVAVEGDAYLQIIVSPASGYDMELGAPTYDGPRRLAGPAGGSVLEAVQTGDFEAVLTWVLGAEERRDFRVRWLGSPSRIVVDVEDA